MKCAVEVRYTFVFDDVENESEAERLADGAIPFIVTDPVSGKRINPDVDSYEVT